FPEILKEYRETQEMLAELRDGSIEEKRPGMIETIRLRNKGLFVLHHMQIRLLRKWRGQTEDEKLLNELLLTVNAIASGLRTTG
ncbi:MAG: phosphoenolpyruvate carboxylase, partial [Leptospiraceae bacterium]|nr:phosphoenolpyruvate carboxylase [Leptospiraceae bacterium]